MALGEAAAVLFTERPLRRGEAEQLSAAIRETPNILGYRASELLRFPTCILAEIEDADGSPELAGICVTKHLAHGWSEIAALCVFPEFRRCGIGEALFRETCRRLRRAGDRILCISREPSVIRWMAAEGMVTQPEWRLPPAVHLAKLIYYADAYRFKEGLRKSVTRGTGATFVYAVWTPPPGSS